MTIRTIDLNICMNVDNKLTDTDEIIIGRVPCIERVCQKRPYYKILHSNQLTFVVIYIVYNII